MSNNDVVDFTDDIRVPRIDPTHNGYPVDHDKVVSGAKTYYRQHRFDLPKRFPSKCDVKISAATIGAGTSEVGCGFEFWIESVV